MKSFTDCIVFLDADFDLAQIGDHDEKSIEAFKVAYQEAAKKIGLLLGCEIRVVCDPPYGAYCESEEWARQAELWQCIHNCIRRTHTGQEPTGWACDEQMCSKHALFISK